MRVMIINGNIINFKYNKASKMASGKLHIEQKA